MKKCFICGKEVPNEEIQRHHNILDLEYEWIMELCCKCHAGIHGKIKREGLKANLINKEVYALIENQLSPKSKKYFDDFFGIKTGKPVGITKLSKKYKKRMPTIYAHVYKCFFKYKKYLNLYKQGFLRETHYKI